MMSTSIPDSHKDLLGAPVYVDLVTVMPDGQPQASVVWCSYDGKHVLVNTAVGRQKESNMQARPKATILSVDPQNPFRYLEVRGTVEAITEDGAMEHINALAKAYRNADSYYGGVMPADMAEKETRVICKIKPTRVNAMG
jgi:PPOX class probable F420-dependent enzyme